jgi:hypothetical protein
MGENGHRYVLELFNKDGSPLGQAPMEPDWTPALEWTLFAFIRRGRLPPTMMPRPHAITPVWDPHLGKPYVAGFRITLWGWGGRDELATDFSTSYFRDHAQQASSRFVERGLLEFGERFWYAVSAFPTEPELPTQAAKPEGFSVQEIATPIPLGDKPLAALLRASVQLGQAHDEDMPVFVPQQVMDEVVTLAKAPGAEETGGVLIGKLYNDAGSPEIMVEVSGQVSAQHVHAELYRLGFTAETWTAVKAAIDLRSDDEIMVGWWHTHRYRKETCKGCEKRYAGTCASPIFMSPQDLHFQRTVFFRPWSIALVIGSSPSGCLDFALYGWRHGIVEPRAFHLILNRAEADSPVDSAPHVRGGEADGQKSDDCRIKNADRHG